MTAARRERARRVLGIEIAALSALRDRLDVDVERALDVLLACRGKVVVTGLGKSGIVARKIAATFASTGTPALFLHAGEGAHGDVGTLGRGDVLLALSNSGETQEVLHLVPAARRFEVPIVAVTGRIDSALARAADAVLDVHVAEEGCPLGLAPMASTTAMMVLGDALAAALLEERGFTADDFALLHPAGALGRKLLRVGDVMRSGPDMPVITAGAGLKDVILEMTKKRLGVTAVLDEQGLLAGIVTDGDLRRGLERAADIRTLRADELMTRSPKTIGPHALAAQAVAMMERFQITSLFVLADDSRRPEGVLHLHDVLRAGIV